MVVSNGWKFVAYAGVFIDIVVSLTLADRASSTLDWVGVILLTVATVVLLGLVVFSDDPREDKND